jgi:hypothetical protein
MSLLKAFFPLGDNIESCAQIQRLDQLVNYRTRYFTIEYIQEGAFRWFYILPKLTFCKCLLQPVFPNPQCST